RPLVGVARVVRRVVVGSQARIDDPLGPQPILRFELELTPALTPRDGEVGVIALAVLVAYLARPAGAKRSAKRKRIACPVRRDGGAGTIVAFLAIIEPQGTGRQRPDEKQAGGRPRAVDVGELVREVVDLAACREEAERRARLTERVAYVERGAELLLEARAVERRAIHE